jgi:hypothetical protein
MALTPRGRAMRHLSLKRGITEQPPGSNTDERKWGIRRAQIDATDGAMWAVGKAWCGAWARWALQKGGVQGLSWRQLAVRLIQADAKAKVGPFRDWLPVSEYRRVLRGDLVTWFGGAHVETVRGFKRRRGRIYAICEGGNTSDGIAGSQSDGGGAYRRVRPLSQADGFARVRYRVSRRSALIDRAAMRATAIRHWPTAPDSPPTGVISSDAILLAQLRAANDPEARELVRALEALSDYRP